MNRQNDPAAWTPRERGERLLEEDRFAEAAQEFSRALQSDPANAELLRLRSLAFFYEAEFEKSLADLDAAAEAAPRDPLSYLRRAETQSVLDETAERLEDLNRVFELDPESADGYANLAAYWLAHFDLEKARSAAARALRIDPKNHATMSCYAAIRAWSGGNADAEILIEHACIILEKRLEAGPRDFDPLLFYASLLSDRSDEPARELIEEGVRRFPKLPFFYLLRAAHHFKWGRPEAAEAGFDAAEKMLDRLGLRISSYFLGRIDLLIQRDEKEAASELLQKFLAWMPDNPDAKLRELILMRERIAMGEESLEKALEKAERLCELTPRYSHALLCRGVLLHQKGDEHAAENDFEQALQTLPSGSADRCDAARFVRCRSLSQGP